MKKSVLVVLCFMLAAPVCGFAAETNSPDVERREHRKEMKKIKEEMRQARKNAPAAAPQNKGSDFWSKEGERSGLGNTGERMGNFFKNLNPAPFFKNQQEQYAARKAAARKATT